MIYPDEEVRNYRLDSFTSMINGENNNLIFILVVDLILNLFWSRQSLHRHNLSFTGFVRRQGVADKSGTKTPRPSGASSLYSNTLTQDGAVGLHKCYRRTTAALTQYFGSTLPMSRQEKILSGHYKWRLTLASGTVSHGDCQVGQLPKISQLSYSLAVQDSPLALSQAKFNGSLRPTR